MKKSKIVAVYPELSDITPESTERILVACSEILALCAERKLTISDMQSLNKIINERVISTVYHTESENSTKF